ncbi:sulfotransferase domain-containing protein [Lentzea atacamensis]|uniref:Sulfotransferase domain-containing protein n=1 Tax=Lentzea atacamensis TaxID=531938 RepID=A0A316HU06_9PSEU|nr:sulfotransferase domain-containing protein [Lentzea atacamensis]PWK84882.1 sulfotransferase domain-containing protein [Lentzea atacamensis]
MSVLMPDSGLALGRVSDLYRRNLAALGPQDVIIASHGGSGQSLIGNILYELGLNYVDAYTEVLHADGRAVAADAHSAYRTHFASLHDKDTGGEARPARLWPRLVKTHHVPVVFSEATFGGVWLLVRDPRDAIYASYHWRSRFGEEPWDQVPDTFEAWLSGPGDFSRSPADDWAAFYTAWAGAFPQADVLRFEDLKQRPVEVVTDIVRRLGVEVGEADVTRAVDASSFTRMREHEERAAGSRPGGGRMVREGKTDGWKGWMNPDLAGYFTSVELRTTAREYGYDLPESP